MCYTMVMMSSMYFIKYWWSYWNTKTCQPNKFNQQNKIPLVGDILALRNTKLLISFRFLSHFDSTLVFVLAVETFVKRYFRYICMWLLEKLWFQPNIFFVTNKANTQTRKQIWVHYCVFVLGSPVFFPFYIRIYRW